MGEVFCVNVCDSYSAGATSGVRKEVGANHYRGDISANKYESANGLTHFYHGFALLGH
jgi:hypothetical protein